MNSMIRSCFSVKYISYNPYGRVSRGLGLPEKKNQAALVTEWEAIDMRTSCLLTLSLLRTVSGVWCRSPFVQRWEERTLAKLVMHRYQYADKNLAKNPRSSMKVCYVKKASARFSADNVRPAANEYQAERAETLPTVRGKKELRNYDSCSGDR